MTSRLLLLLLGTLPALAQDLSYQAIDKARGLPTNTVYDLMQDRRGFIWLGTDKGLFRYDGVHCRPYGNVQQSDKSVSNLMEDADGRVWCQNFTGQFFFTKGDSLHYCAALRSLGAYYPAAIIGGRTLMSVGKQGIRRYELGTLRLSETPMSTSTLRPYAQVNSGYYYLTDANTNRLIGISPAGRQVSIMAAPDSSTFYHAVVNETLFLIPKTDATQLIARPRAGRPYTIRLTRPSMIQNVKVIDDRYLGLFTAAGFYLIDIQSTVRQVAPQLTAKNCAAMMRDREGNFWLATINNGLLLIPSLSVNVIAAGKPFSRLQYVGNETTGPSLFYGTANGEMGRLSLRTLHPTPLHKAATNAEVLSVFHDPARQQTLFCSDQFYRLQRGRLESFETMSVKDIEPVNDKLVALAASGVFGRVQTDQRAPSIERLGNHDERVRSVAVLPSGTKPPTMYVVAASGLWRYQDGQQPRTITNRGAPYALTDLTVTQTPAPLLFAASPMQGVFAFQNDRQVLHLTKTSGLADNSVYRIRAYKNEVWWLTEKTVQAYDLTTKRLRTYDQTDGLPDTDLKDLAFANDTAYIATLAGLVCFPTNQPATNPHHPEVIVTGLFRNREPVSINKPARFAHDQNTVDIRYSVLSFRSQGAIRVFYRVNDQGWVRTDDKQRILSLPSLAPDDYTVQLKAVNEDGLESQAPAVVRFRITQPFWLQYWFLGLVALNVGFVTYLTYRNRMRRVARENALQTERNRLAQEVQKSRLTAIKSQMNPHFLFNALNTIQSYIYLNEKQQASTYLVKFSELTRMILDMSGHDTVSLTEELKAIGLYLELEQMRFEDTLTYRITVDDALDPDQVRIPSMLIQPYIENAIKHGLMHKKTDRHLLVDFQRTGNVLQVSIDDNGVGRVRSAEINRHRAKHHDSFASEANQKRLELLNDGQHAQIALEILDKTEPNGQPCGTRVILRLPL